MDKFNIYAINLERRLDRKQNILHQFKDFDFCNIKFFKAIEHEVPYVGCGLSHLSLIKFAKDNDMDYIIVVEDDILFNEWVGKKELNEILTTLTKNWSKYEIFNGSPTFWNKRENINEIKKTKSPISKFSFVSDAQTAIFMIYTRNSYDKILSGHHPLETKLGSDEFFGQNFMQLCYERYLCQQIVGYSDLRKCVTNLKSYFEEQENIFQKLPCKDFSNKIYSFWTGSNEMSFNRKKCLAQLKEVSECEVILVTKDNLKDYLTEPLHPAYEYLSETHKADYLRTYFMHFIGGGYSDVKKTRGSWKKAFEEFYNDELIWAIGYPEISGGVGYPPYSNNWREMIGNGCYICRKKTPLTTEWYGEMVRFLDTKLEALKINPAQGPQDSSEKGFGYPIEWNEMLGRIFHKYSFDFKDHVRRSVPMCICNEYR